jgi:hypothetical protein
METLGLLVPGRTGASERSRRSTRPRGAFAALNLTGIEKRGRGGGYPASAGRRRRRHRDKAAESEKADAIPDLLLKYLDTILVITLTKTHEKHLKIIVKHTRHPYKTLATYV